MRLLASLAAVMFAMGLLGPGLAMAAEDSKMKQGTQQVESGAKEIGKGVEDTA